MTKTSKTIIAFFALTIIITSVLAFSFSINKPFTLDEVEEARMAEKINIIGPATFHPVSDGGGGEPLSHPLLYSYTNAIFYKLFGSSEVSLRSYGVVFFILSLWVLCFFVADVFKGSEHKKIAVVIASLLYIGNPLLIQHSMLLNADNNISAFFIILYVYLFYIFEKREEKDFVRTRFILAIIVALNFLAKEITPMFMLLSVAVYRLLNRNLKKFIIDLFCNVIFGLILFWIVWSLYCLFTNTDVLAFIKFTLVRKAPKVATLSFLKRQLQIFFLLWKWPVYWVGAPFFMVLFYGVIKRKIEIFKTKRLLPEDFIWIASFVMFLPFIFIKPSMDMMKYQYPVYPLFIVLIAWICFKFIKIDLTLLLRKRNFVGLFFLFTMMCVWYYRLGDYVLLFWQKMPAKFMMLYYLPILLIFVVFLFMDKKRKKANVFLSACLFLILPVNIGLNLNQLRDYTTAESWLNYGERGLKKTTEYLKDHVDPQRIVFCRKDIAYYLNFRYNLDVETKETTPIFKLRRVAQIKRALDLDHVQYFVFDRISSVVKARKDIFDILSQYFVLEQRFGDFIILRRR